MARHRILANTVAYSMADFSGPLVSMFMLPVYTRFMTPADYGVVSIVQSFTRLVAVFGSLQMSAGLGRLFFDYDDASKRKYFSSVLVAVTGTSALVLVPIHMFGDSITTLMFPNAGITYVPYFFLGVCTVFFNQIVIATNRLQKSREKGITVGVISVIAILIGVGIRMWLVVGLGMGAHGALLATLVTAGVHATILVVSASSFLTLRLEVAMMVDSLKYGFPLVFHAFGGYLFMYSNRIILEKFVSLAAIGLFNVADRLSMAMKILVNSVNAALSPRFVKASQQNREEAVAWYRRVMAFWAVAIGVVFLGIVLFAKEAVFLLTGPAYHSAYVFVAPLSFAYVFRGLYTFGINAVLFQKKSHLVPVVTIVAGVTNVVLTIIFVRNLGAIGAAISTMLAFAITFFLALAFSNRHYPLSWPTRDFLVVGVPVLSVATLTVLMDPPVGVANATAKAATWLLLVVAFVTFDVGNVRTLFVQRRIR